MSRLFDFWWPMAAIFDFFATKKWKQLFSILLWPIEEKNHHYSNSIIMKKKTTIKIYYINAYTIGSLVIFLTKLLYSHSRCIRWGVSLFLWQHLLWLWLALLLAESRLSYFFHTRYGYHNITKCLESHSMACVSVYAYFLINEVGPIIVKKYFVY